MADGPIIPNHKSAGRIGATASPEPQCITLVNYTIIAGALPYNIKYLEVITVVIWCYGNKTGSTVGLKCPRTGGPGGMNAVLACMDRLQLQY